MSERRALLGRVWMSDRSLSALLALLVIDAFVVTPVTQVRGSPQILGQVLFTLILVSGVATTLRRRLVTLLVGALAVIGIGVRWVDFASPSVPLARVDAALELVFCMLLAWVIIAQVFRPGPINAHRIQGAIAVYLLLAFAWALTYLEIALADPTAFSFPAATLFEHPHVLLSRLSYFSLITMTTVGYGDITPVHPFARSFACLEALTGQLFPAILLARLVAMELYQRQQQDR